MNTLWGKYNKSKLRRYIITSLGVSLGISRRINMQRFSGIALILVLVGSNCKELDSKEKTNNTHRVWNRITFDCLYYQIYITT
jgi:hypothetical protein